MCGVGVVPKEEGAGVEVPPCGASAAASVEIDAASQASEPASQASDEEDAPSTDIYFVSSPQDPSSGPFGPLASKAPVDSYNCFCLWCDHSGWQGHCSPWPWGHLSKDGGPVSLASWEPRESFVLLGEGHS